MTLDQSLANLQRQADRLAGIFASTADAIEASPHPYVGTDPVAAYAKGVSDAMAPQQASEPNHVDQAPTATANYPLPPREELSGDHWDVVHDARGNTVTNEPAPEPANPFEALSASASLPGGEVPAPAKKKGRRTHDELAQDVGVKLDDVKAWLGKDGKVTKAAIEDFAAKHPEKVAMNNQQLPGITTPPDGSHLPEAASDPFGGTPVSTPPTPQQLAPAAVVAPENPFGPDVDGNPVDPFGGTPVVATPEDPFAQGSGADAPISDWNPFES